MVDRFLESNTDFTREDLFVEVFQSTPNLLCIIGVDGEIIDVNRKLLEIFGYARSNLVGRPLSILFSPSLRGRMDGILIDARTNGHSSAMFLGQKSNGEGITLEVLVNAPNVGKKGSHLTVFMRDFTEHKIESRLSVLTGEIDRRIVSGENLQGVLTFICHGVVNTFDAVKKAWIGLKQPGSTIISTIADENGLITKLDERCEDATGGICPTGTVLETGLPHVFNGQWECPGFLSQCSDALSDGYGSHAVLPLELSDVSETGVLNVYSDEADAFKPELMNQLSKIANKVAIVLEMYRSQQKLQKRTEEVEMLFEAGRQLNRSLDIKDVYATLHRLISRSMDCDSLFVSSYSPEDNLIRCVLSYYEGKCMDPGLYPPIPLEPEGSGTQSVVIRTGNPSLIPDYDEQLKKTVTTDFIGTEGDLKETISEEDEHIRSAIIVPMILEGSVVGAINVQSYRLNAYTKEHLKLLEAVASQLATASANAALYQMVLGEVDERKMLKTEIQNINEFYESILEGIINGVWVSDTDDVITYANSGMGVIAGRPVEKIIRSRVLEGVPEAKLTIFKPLYEKARDTLQPVYYESIPVVTYDGEQKYRTGCLMPRIFKGAFNGMICTVNDVTERMRAERLHMENLALEEANRMKNEFVASMSHDIRTPLNAILGYSELMQDEVYGNLNEKQMEQVNLVYRSGESLLALIDDILDLSKIENGKLRFNYAILSIEEVVQDVQNVNVHAIEQKRHELDIDIQPGIRIWADEHRIKQCLNNLLNNAIKFTPEGRHISIGAREIGDVVEISVSDDGIGISANHIEKIFQPFYRVGIEKHGSEEGTGLGLPISKRIVEMMGGRMYVESEEGVGSRFSFTLSVYRPDIHG